MLRNERDIRKTKSSGGGCGGGGQAFQPKTIAVTTCLLKNEESGGIEPTPHVQVESHKKPQSGKR